MAKYAYPAVFTPEKNGFYSIAFPDLESCYTCGDSIEDGIEKEKKEIPKPSTLDAIPLSDGCFANYIACDTMAYRKRYNNKAVKKTLTVPEWLNEAAMEKGLNFSQVLQEALIQKIDGE